MDIQDIKLFLRIGHDEEDDLLNSLKIASEEYLYNAGCIKNYENELYKLSIKLLIVHWYENRGLIGNATYVKHSLESMIYQLRDTRIIEGELDG